MSILLSKTLAASPATERGKPTQLSCDPKGERIAYASGKSVFLRSLDDPSISKQYTNHTTQTTVARFSPSGFYVASGDVSGSVKVWDALEAQNTKGDYHIISGRINDIAWDGDSQRIIAVGNGREKFGHCITADSGNTVGEISGHSSAINSVSIRQQRPLRAATGSDDASMVFLHGAPFKFATKLGGLHTNFLWGVQFSPDGNHLVSVGSDRRIQLYDGKTGDTKGTIGKDAHKGSIFAVSWSKDSKRLVTASADQTVKLWDVEADKAVQTWRFGDEGVVSIPDHQVGVAWPHGRSDGLILSLNLEGDLNYLVEGQQSSTRVIQGHNKAITACGVAADTKASTFWTGSYDGRVCMWNTGDGLATRVDGSGHSNQLAGFENIAGRTYSAAWDDTLRIADVDTKMYIGEAQKLSAQPKSLASSEGRVFVATAIGVEVFQHDKLLNKLDIKDVSPTCIAAYGNIVAVGDDANKVTIYTIDSNHKLAQHTEITRSTNQITSVAFSPNGSHLAVGNASGKIFVCDAKTFEVVTDRWSAHTARIMSMRWNQAGTMIVTGSLDTHIFVWSLKNPGKRIKAANAHKDGVTAVGWVDGDSKVVSAGGDAAVKIWEVKYDEA